MTIEQLKKDVRNVPDFPKKGIQFKDITTIVANPEELRFMCKQLADVYRQKGITKVVGSESRGFSLAPAVAMELGAGFVPVRKHGKLPYETIEVSYEKEYGMEKIYVNCLIELIGLNGREYLQGENVDIDCLMEIEVDE